MEWDGQRKKQFRDVLLKVYRSWKALQMFVVDNDIDINLARISNDRLEEAAFDLIEEAESQGHLDELFDTFCRKNANNSTVAKDIAELKGDRFIEPPENNQKISSQKWDELFSFFSDEDLLGKACQGALQYCLNWLPEEIDYDYTYSNRIHDIRELLEKHDNPKVAIAVANRVCQLVRQLEGNTARIQKIKRWRNRIAQKYNLSGEIGTENKLAYGHLIVAVQPKSRYCWIVPELHFSQNQEAEPVAIDIEPIPIDINDIDIKNNNDDNDGNDIFRGFDALQQEINKEVQRGITCQYNEVPHYLSKCLIKADKILYNQNILSPAIVEIFLPGKYLHTKIHDEWSITDQSNEAYTLGENREFIVRSLERATKEKLKMNLKTAWEKWKDSLQDRQVVDRFGEVDSQNCTRFFNYYNTKHEMPGVKFIDGFPQKEQHDILRDLIYCCLPFAFWTYEKFDCLQTIRALDALIGSANLSNFRDLAIAIMRKRNESPDNPIRELGMLCDCPERMPTLPANATSSRLHTS